MDRDKKICLVVKTFLEHPDLSMSALANLPGLQTISKATINRYLNDKAIIELFDEETYNKIQQILKQRTEGMNKKADVDFFKLVVKTFLENSNLTLEELSKKPEFKGLSSSSIQRYLKDPLIIELFDQATYEKIQKELLESKMDGHRKGGLHYFENNKPVKDEFGQFQGSIKSLEPSRIETKIKHILAFANVFLNNPEMSLQDIADFFNEASEGKYHFTKAYVYDCLSSKDIYDVLERDKWEKIAFQLEERRHQGNINGAIQKNSQNHKK